MYKNKNVIKKAVEVLRYYEEGDNVKRIEGEKDLMNVSSLLKILLPLDKYKGLIATMRNEAKANLSGIMEVIIGAEGPLAYLHEAILKIAFPQTFALPGDRGTDYDVSSEKISGPSGNLTIQTLTRIFYGKERRFDINSLARWKDDQHIGQSLRNRIPPLVDAETTPDIIAALGTAYENNEDNISNITNRLNSEDNKLENWIEILREVDSKKNEHLNNYREFEANPPIGSRRTFESKLDQLKIFFKNFEILEESLLQPFEIKVPGALEEQKRDEKDSFITWKGEIPTLIEILGLTYINSDENFYLADLKDKESLYRKREEELFRVNNIIENYTLADHLQNDLKNEILIIPDIINTTEFRAKLENFSDADFNRYINKPFEFPNSEQWQGTNAARLDQIHKSIARYTTNKKVFDEERAESIATSIRGMIIPKLRNITRANPEDLTELVNELIKSYEDNILPSLTKKKPDVRIMSVGSHKEKRRKLLNSITKKVVAMPRVLLLQNLDTNPKLVKERLENPESMREIQNQRSQGNRASGKFTVNKQVLNVLKQQYNKQRNLHPPIRSKHIKQGHIYPPQCVVFTTNERIDFPVEDNITYIDFNDYRVDDQVAIALLNYASNTMQVKKIKASTMLLLKKFLIGRTVSDALQTIGSVFIECLREGDGEQAQKCVIAKCKDITATQLSREYSLLQVEIADKPKESFIPPKNSNSGAWVQIKFDMADELRNSYFIMAEKLDAIQDLEIKLKITTDPRQRSEIEKNMKILKRDYDVIKKDYDASGLGEEVLFILYGDPGVGKSAIPETLATQLGWDYYPLRLQKIRTKWLGDSEKILDKLLYVDLLQRRNCIVDIDEMDAMPGFGIAKGSGETTAVEETLEAMIKTFLEKHKDTLSKNHVYIFGSTNHPEKICQAIIDRSEQIEIESAISPENALPILKSTFAQLLKRKDVAGLAEAVSEADKIIAQEWDDKMKLVWSFGEDAIMKGVENLSSTRASFRGLFNVIASIFYNHKRFLKMKKMEEDFYSDTTPTKENWKKDRKVYYDNWVARGSPPDQPRDPKSFPGIELTKDSWLSQTLSTPKTYRTITGEDFKSFTPGYLREAVKVMEIQGTEKLRKREPEQQELFPIDVQKGMQLEQKIKPEDELAKKVSPETTPMPSPALTSPLEEKPTLPSQPKTETETLGEKMKMKQEISTDYYYDLLLKKGIIKKDKNNKTSQLSNAETSKIKAEKLRQHYNLPIFTVGGAVFLPR